MTTLPDEILTQCEALDVNPDQPLIITDADEVLLQFMVQFEFYLDKQNLWIDLQDFKREGNIKHKDTNIRADANVRDMLDDFFAAETPHLKPVARAAESLTHLSDHAQIMVLTNLPLAFRDDRVKNLQNHGMDYPVIVGNGPKGPVIKWLGDKTTAPVFFLDDISYNIDSAGEHAPDSWRIHMIADKRLRDVVKPATKASARIDEWPVATSWILQKLGL